MIIEFDISNPEAFEGIAMTAFEKARVPCQAAMANRFATIVNRNFGFEGEDRPKPWPALSDKYAREFHDGETTATLVLSGDLQSSIQIDENNPNAAKVFTLNDYAEAHQNGISGKLHARPFFPMDEHGQVTLYTIGQVTNAAQEALNRI